MLTIENIYFLRIVLVLYEVSSIVLKHVVTRELQKQGDSLDQVLKKYEKKLKVELHGNRSQLDKIFPSGGKSDINTWDCQLLAVVISLLFRSTLTKEENINVRTIKHIRNEIVAHRTSAAFTEEGYDGAKEQLIEAINKLASGFDSGIRDKCSELIAYYCSLTFDTQKALQHLKESIQTDDCLHEVLLDAVNKVGETVCIAVSEAIEATSSNIKDQANRLEEKIVNARNTICQNGAQNKEQITNEFRLEIGKVGTQHKQSLKVINEGLEAATVRITNKVENNNSNLMHVLQERDAKIDAKLDEMKRLVENLKSGNDNLKRLKFGTHTHLTVDGTTQEWIDMVETVLKEVFDCLLKNVQEPGKNPETQKAVQEFIDFIKGFKCVELQCVERKCIILVFECSTYDSLIELLQFIYDSCFQNYLENISRALECDLGLPQRINFSFEIPIHSLQLKFDDTNEENITGLTCVGQQFQETLRHKEEAIKTENEALLQPLTTPQEKLSDSIWKKSKLVVAAIDFGTTYSGYAFSFKESLQQNILKVQGKNWQNSQISKIVKIPTVILFDKEGKFHSFGYEAEEKYADLADDESHFGWKYFKHFKMALHGQKRLRHKIRLTDDQGKTMLAKDVFAAAIQYLKNDLLETMKQRAPDFQETDVMWIITVPTIWTYGAKYFMKEAAARAGIPDDQLTFALEPEAGALFCEQIKDHNLSHGSKFMVVDLGGGIADITISEVQGDGTLGELYPPSGGPWGGTLVDSRIKYFLENLFGIAVMNEFRKEYKCEHLVLVESIEMKKREFGKSSDGVKLKLSHHLLEIYRKHNSVTGSIQEDIKSKGLGDVVNLDEKHNYLKLTHKFFKRMFEESVVNLIKHLNYLFKKPELDQVNIVMMIGGFSESAVIQRAVRDAFPNKTVIIPEEAGLAVLRGTVIYGYKQNLISSRKLPTEYRLL